MMSDLPVLEAAQLIKTFDYPTNLSILSGVNLKAYPGDSIAISGRSGEGKSTLLQILGTLEPPSSGHVTIKGQAATAFNSAALRSSHVGFIFQSFHLMDDFTVLENVLMPAYIARKKIHKYSEAYKRAEWLLDQVGLSQRTHYLSKLLSGGEKQRVAIARALCNDPDLLLADEPSGNLDKQNADEVHRLLLHFSETYKKTLVVVTHDLQLASLCRQQFHLQEGKLVLTKSF